MKPFDIEGHIQKFREVRGRIHTSKRAENTRLLITQSEKIEQEITQAFSELSKENESRLNEKVQQIYKIHADGKLEPKLKDTYRMFFQHETYILISTDRAPKQRSMDEPDITLILSGGGIWQYNYCNPEPANGKNMSSEQFIDQILNDLKP